LAAAEFSGLGILAANVINIVAGESVAEMSTLGYCAHHHP